MILSLHKVYTTHVNYQYLLILNHFSKPKKSLPMTKLTLIFLSIMLKKKKNKTNVDTSARDPRKRTQRTQPVATWQHTISKF